MAKAEIQNLSDARQRIQTALDEAWPSGMSLNEADFNLEIASRLDVVALDYMQQFKTLRAISMDEWLAEHREALTGEERAIGHEILQAYDTEPPDETPTPEM